MTEGSSGRAGTGGILGGMASLTASSTLGEIKGAYDENLDYDLVGVVGGWQVLDRKGEVGIGDMGDVLREKVCTADAARPVPVERYRV